MARGKDFLLDSLFLLTDSNTKGRTTLPSVFSLDKRKRLRSVFQLGEEVGFQNQPWGLTRGESGFLPFEVIFTRISKATPNGSTWSEKTSLLSTVRHGSQVRMGRAPREKAPS